MLVMCSSKCIHIRNNIFQQGTQGVCAQGTISKRRYRRLQKVESSRGEPCLNFVEWSRYTMIVEPFSILIEWQILYVECGAVKSTKDDH